MGDIRTQQYFIESPERGVLAQSLAATVLSITPVGRTQRSGENKA